jgi:sodium-dependent dicarboxylate transporter 2/3/5
VNIKKGEFVLTWQYAEKLPWGILLLFGGGLSLASAINQTGLASWIGDGLSGISEWPLVLLIMVFTVLIIFLTELNSNTATAAAFLPIAASVALAINKSPMQFVVPVTLAASCAFMLPVATPPNAIIFGSGRITVPEMAKAGIILNIFFSILITIVSFFLVSRVLRF